MSDFQVQNDAMKKEHLSYVENHPELKSIMNDFLCQVLVEKPDDIQGFAARYFSSYLPGDSEEELSHPLVICGPSGAGKGTLIKKLFEDFEGKLGYSVSHTTRQPRDGEENGVHYHFTTVDEMQKQIDDGLFIESANVHGNFYGTSAAAVKAVCGDGRVCLLEIDINGVMAVKASDLKPRIVYVAPPSHEVLEHRLRSRGSESEEDIIKRLQNAKEEMEWLDTEGNSDVKIVNDDLEEAYATLKQHVVDWYPEILH